MKAFITLQHGQRKLGTLHLILYEDKVPKTVQNFAALLQRPAGEGYLGCSFHRIIREFMAQGGDFTAGDGTGGESIFGKTFDDENFSQKHLKAGTLSMANAGPHTNGSQFFITFKPVPHLDGKHVVFGHVDLTQSADVLNALERVRTNSGDKPLEPVIVTECGVLEDDRSSAANADVDEDEVVLDEEEEDSNNPDHEENPEEGPGQAPRNKQEEIKLRLRKLRQKINQARQLNKQAVKEEGERLTQGGYVKEQKRQAAVEKKAKEAAWEAQNSKAIQAAAKVGIDPKLLTQQAAESLIKERTRAEKEEIQQYQVNDYHNPEGQHRNYLRNVKSLSRRVENNDTTYDPIQDEADPEREREGARRIASEMHRRIEKSQKRDRERKRKEMSEDGDVSHINQRNKGFNKKINRTYDKQTAEIRQNLERGTAL